MTTQFSSVQFSRSVMSDSLRPHEPQHARPPCPSPTPGVDSNSCPSSRWCHPSISSSVVPSSSCPQSLPASGSLPMSQLFAWGGQSTGVSASASVLPMNTQDWSPLVRQMTTTSAHLPKSIKGIPRSIQLIHFGCIYILSTLLLISKSISQDDQGQLPLWVLLLLFCYWFLAWRVQKRLGRSHCLKCSLLLSVSPMELYTSGNRYVDLQSQGFGGWETQIL